MSIFDEEDGVYVSYKISEEEFTGDFDELPRGIIKQLLRQVHMYECPECGREQPHVMVYGHNMVYDCRGPTCTARIKVVG